MAQINLSFGQHVLDNLPVSCTDADFNRAFKRIKKWARIIRITNQDTKTQLDAKKARLPYIWHAMKDATKGRNAANAGDRDVLFLDMDGCNAAAWQALRKVLAFFSCFTWSTPSHLHPTANGKQRWRICFELSHRVTPEEYRRLGLAVELWLMDCISLMDDYVVKWDHSVYNPDHMVFVPHENAVFERFTGEPVDVDMMLATDISRVTDSGSPVAVRETDPDDLSRIVDLNGISPQTFDDLREVMWHPAVLADAEPGCGKYPCWAAMGNRLAWFKDTEWEDAARQLWIDWSIAGGGDGTSAEHKWDSDQLTAERTGYQAIFARARKLGVANPATDRPHGSVASVDDFDELPPEEPEPPKSRPHTGGYGKPGQFVIEGMVPHGVTMLYGASSSFKSYGVISMLCRVATKTHRWGGRNIKGGAVLYVAAEGGSSVMPRVGAWADKYNDGNPLDLFYTLPLAVDLSVPANVTKMVKEIRHIAHHTGEPVRIVAVDTLSQSMMQGEENSASDVAKFMAGATRVFTETGAAVIIVHHSGKDSSKGMRGSSAAFANADAVIRVERIGDAVNIINEKQRTGPVQPTRSYMVPTVPLPDDVIAANEAYDEEYTSTEGEVYDPVRLTTERVFEDVPMAEITPLLMEDDTRDRRKVITRDWIFEQLDESGGRISREELGTLWVENGGKEDTFRRTINRMAKDKDIVKTPDGFIVDAVLGVSDKEGGENA
ncbi:AAA family ATPase [Salmonella enterica]|nr:AAA family ATPase [Salmonella enterica subsp. enterica serovar Javiana]